MSSQKHIQDELKSLESSLPFNNIQPLSVPEGYFEGLPAAILAKVKSSAASAEAELGELSPLLAGIPKVTPYSVPFSYFQENVDGITGITQEIESPVLPGVEKEMPYALPQGYFETFPPSVLNKIAQPKARVVPLFARTWMRVASAAVVAGALLFGGLQLFSGKPDESGQVAGGNAIDTTQTQVAQTTTPVVKEIKQASTKELEDFIETVQVKPSNSGKDVASNKKEVENLLKDVSTNEMETFLSELSTADDDLSLTD